MSTLKILFIANNSQERADTELLVDGLNSDIGEIENVLSNKLITVDAI